VCVPTARAVSPVSRRERGDLDASTGEQSGSRDQQRVDLLLGNACKCRVQHQCCPFRGSEFPVGLKPSVAAVMQSTVSAV
jgi:hypothetical protein